MELGGDSDWLGEAPAALRTLAERASGCAEYEPRVAVVGGDGTVSALLSLLDSRSAWPAGQRRPAVAVLPAGTGNDLARCLGWADAVGPLSTAALGGAAGAAAARALRRRVASSPSAALDRWALRGAAGAAAFQNYASIGFDAGVALAFHEARGANPSLFRERLLNKAAYGLLGAAAFAANSCARLDERLLLEADGVRVPLPPGARGACCDASGAPFATRSRARASGLLLLNISSFMGGVRPWRGAASASDGLLEVCCHYGALHLARMQLGVDCALPLCTARQLRISLTEGTLPMQADGEPWMQAAGVVEVQLQGQARMVWTEGAAG